MASSRRVQPPQDGPPSEVAQTPPRNLHATTDIKFVIMELGKLTERVDALKETTRGGSTLQIGVSLAGVIVVLALAALGAFGFSSRFASLEAKIDKLEERLGNRLDRVDDHGAALRDRVTRLEVRTPH